VRRLPRAGVAFGLSVPGTFFAIHGNVHPGQSMRYRWLDPDFQTLAREVAFLTARKASQRRSATPDTFTSPEEDEAVTQRGTNGYTTV
jgi:hypothetical protein